MSYFQVVVELSTDKKYVKLLGKINEYVKDKTLTFVASTPYDRRTSFSGSGLPFPNSKFAFENSPNVGSLKLDKNNSFVLEMQIPNSYYVALGTVLVPPTVYFSYSNGYATKKNAIKVCDSLPYRSLTYPQGRTDATFYISYLNLPVRGQEEIIKTNAYPSDTMMEYDKFWGGRPPV